MNRPSFQQICMGIAERISERSTCVRLKVGCVIASTDFRKILAWGYNGNTTGGPNECDRVGDIAVGSCGCIHGEANAVINCDAPRAVEKTVFCTHSPCVMCAKFLINLGNVKSVYYRNEYRKDDGLLWLRGASIITTNLETE